VTLRTVANVVEALVAAAVVVFVVLLFTNEPTAPPAAPATAAAAGTAGSAPTPALDAAALFGDNCAGCHGGDGSGGIGPRLGGGRVVAVYPDPAAQVAVVTEGRDGMPAFGARLSEDEIAAIVDYTRTVLAGG
jgi:mono/diheme cytochrome c family protein